MNILIFREGKPERFKEHGVFTDHRVVEVWYGEQVVGKIVESSNESYWTKGTFSVSTKTEIPSHMNNGFGYQSRVNSVIEGKKLICELWNDPDERSKAFGGVTESRKTRKVELLPEGDNSDFYPTPDNLAGKMLGKLNWSKIRSILEPEAGKGDLVDSILRFVDANKYRAKRRSALNHYLVNDNGRSELDLDCIEPDYNLRLILRGKNYRLVAEDFLSYETQRPYSAIIMNPPFSQGAEHLLKAISVQERFGGQIVCLLNAETLLNPYSNVRKELRAKLDKYGASVEIVRDAFKKAERKTDVAIAIVYLSIDFPKRESKILEHMKKAQQQKYSAAEMEERALVYGDSIEQSIQHFELEARVGRELIEEYCALIPSISWDGKSAPLLTLKTDKAEIRKPEDVEISVNQYLRSLRYKYWSIYLNRPEIQAKLTSKMSSEYQEKLSDMENYDYSIFNIQQLNFDMQQQLIAGVQDSIIAIFEKLSQEHSMQEGSSNIHYYNGWKTNKCWKVNSNCIIPAYGSYKRSVFKEDWHGKATDEIDVYDAAQVISDLEKTLNYLNKGEVSGVSIEGALDRAVSRRSKTVSFTYFDVTFYKKGTAHIKFLPEAQPLLDRLNIFAARSRSWLPPSYGRKHYNDMTTEEQAVIDEFQGREMYEKVMEKPSNYILEGSALLQIAS